MKFGPKRGHILQIFDKFFSSFALLIIFLVITVSNGFDQSNSQDMIFLGIALLSPVLNIVKYLTTYYSVSNEMLLIESGFINKKRIEIPLKSITTVDLSQKIIYRIFKVYRIKIDNSSQTNDAIKKSECTLALKEDEAILFKNLVTNKTQEEEQKEIISSKKISASIGDFVLMGVLRSKLLYAIQGAFVIFIVLSFINSNILNDDFSPETIFKVFLSFGGGISLLFIIILVYVVSFCISLIGSIISNYDFKILSNDNSIILEYGLITKKKYSLMKTKINGVILKQNILMRLLGYYTVEVVVIGYGDMDENKKETAMLYPIAKINKVENLLNELLPDFEIVKEFSKPKTSSLKYFYINAGIFIALLTFILLCSSGVLELIILACAFLIFILFSCYLEYKNVAISSNTKNITITNGIYSKKMSIIKTRSIESIVEFSSVLKRRRGVTNIMISFIAPLRNSKIIAKNLTFSDFENLKEKIEY